MIKLSNLKVGIIVFVLLAILGVVFWQKTQTRDISEKNQNGSGFDGRTSTALVSTNINLHQSKQLPSRTRTNFLNLNWFTKKENNEQTKLKKENVSSLTINSISQQMPFGINSPFSYPDTDVSGEKCLKNKGVLMLSSQTGRNYSETHIEKNDLKECLPVAVSYMNNIKDIGVNVISQHFMRRYDENGMPYFGIEEKNHINHEVAIQLYVEGFNNYFWAAVNPVSNKGFVGDINIETHKILAENETSKKAIYLPSSEVGFAEWQKWLNASLDYLKDHNALDKLVYFQIGNESDGDYAKADKIKRDNRNDFYWSAYAKLIEKSYDTIKSKSPKTKIVVGSISSSGVTVDGFQRPVLEYLAGKIDENELFVSGIKKCGGTGCFDVYDYHDFSGYKEYKGRIACQPRDCVNPIITIQKTPEYMKKLLSDNNFSDKKLVVQQGGTYTGQDSKVDQMEKYQTEEDQASYLIKRSVYLLANGVEQIQFGTYIEHSCTDGTIHNWFTMMGFSYNGIPKKGANDCKEKEDKAKLNKKDCDGQLPCPDPGKGVKKLSYFAQKKMIEILKGSDWNSIQIIQEKDGIYVYKIKKNDKSIWVAWNDNPTEKMVEILEITSRAVKITEIIPKYESGKEVTDYNTAFNTKTVFTSRDGAIIPVVTFPCTSGEGTIITLKGVPVFIEEK